MKGTRLWLASWSAKWVAVIVHDGFSAMGYVRAFMNCRGDDDVDAKRSRPSIGKTRKVPREQRARAFGRDSISESHQGQRP
jgi:hypothetical protein